jgi:hypothetical protein
MAGAHRMRRANYSFKRQAALEASTILMSADSLEQFAVRALCRARFLPQSQQALVELPAESERTIDRTSRKRSV